MLVIDDSWEVKLREILKTDLGKDLESFEKIEVGRAHVVLELKTTSDRFIIKIFNSSQWPSTTNLQEVHSYLEERSIKHAKLLNITRDNSHFPFGYALFEFLEGSPMAIALREKLITPEDAFVKMGGYIRSFHEIEISGFGPLTQAKNINFGSWLKDELAWTTSRAGGMDEWGKKAYEELIKRIDSNTPLLDSFRPVLTHGDLTLNNTILLKDGSLAMVDWDNGHGNCWGMDNADLYLKALSFGFDGESFKENFFKGYGKIDLEMQEVETVHNILALYRAYHLYVYFFEDPYNQYDVYNSRELFRSLFGIKA